MASRSCSWTDAGRICYNTHVEKQTGVMDLKKWYKMLAGLTVMLALAGTVLALTRESSMERRSILGRGMLVVSVAGLAVCALLKEKAKDAEKAFTGVEGKTSCAENRCTFSDVAANAEARESLEQLKEYIVAPEKYRKFGARMPGGVLLYGPPGTGKTLLARALAGEAGVPFLALSGSDFVEKYVGVGAKRVRELFKKARKAGKCVVFIDEIDAMGKRRSDHSSDERDQTLNALLSEMSGFYGREGVIVLAATNRIEMLDPALLRPGRFDRQIEVPLPGKRERRSILELHCRNKPLGADVCLDSIAAQTASFSGAALENLMNEASILAANSGADAINMKHIRSALIRIIAGADRKSMADEEERRIIALHEAGHAVAAKIFTPHARLTRVSILPAGRGAAGYNLVTLPESVMLSKRDLENQVCVLLAGRAAEMLIRGEDALTTGAANDLERATEIAAAMVYELGMAGEPAVSLKALSSACPGADRSGDSVRSLLGELFVRTRKALADHAESLDRLAEELLEKESLDEAELQQLLKGVSNERQDPANEDKIR